MGGGSRSRGTPHHRLLASPLHSQRLTRHWHWAQGQGHRGAGCRAVGRGALSHRLQAPHTSPPWGGGCLTTGSWHPTHADRPPHGGDVLQGRGGGGASPQVLGIPRTLTAPRTVVTCCRAGGGGCLTTGSWHPLHAGSASPAGCWQLGRGGGGLTTGCWPSAPVGRKSGRGAGGNSRADSPWWGGDC